VRRIQNQDEVVTNYKDFITELKIEIRQLEDLLKSRSEKEIGRKVLDRMSKELEKLRAENEAHKSHSQMLNSEVCP